MGIVSLTTYSNYNSLGNDINIVGTFSGGEMQKYSDKHVSAPLMNYVEPYDYKGVQKTLFYTEVNTGISVGDRVFIVNGNYDSAELIKIDKYKKGRDGYKVLYVDRCRIVLDIDYTGLRPNNGDIEVGDLMSDYVKIYYIDSYESFVHANRQITSRGGYLGGKFDYYQNNIAFIDTDYSPIDDGWTRTTGVTASPGFYVREPAYDTELTTKTKGEAWQNITDRLMSGSFSFASSQSNPKISLKHFNNNKFIVMERNFRFGDKDYIAGTIYKFDSVLGWIPDVKERGTANRAMITKANFRNGNFTGTIYSGIYGSRDSRIDWTGDGVWLGGTLFNTSWKRGSMFSTILLPESHKAYVDSDRKPKQKLNTFNNGGYGWNYIIDSDFEATSIYNSIIRNTRFGMTPSIPVVERHVLGATQTFDRILSGGLYENCEFNNTMLSESTIKNSRTSNSLLHGVKHINSWTRRSVIKDSTLIADSIIKIDGYDEWTASEKRGSQTYGPTFSNGVDFKVYKFYIGEADYFKLKSRDSFYIRGVRVSNEPELLNFFDRKFVIGNWTEFIDDFNHEPKKIGQVEPYTFYKRGVVCAAFLSTAEENEWVYSSTRYETIVTNQQNNFIQTNGYITDTIFENPNPRYSIDIFVSIQDVDKNNLSNINFNYSTASVSSLEYILPKKLSDRIDVSAAYIIDSDIESGIVENCNWNSGSLIGYNNDLIISGLTNSSDTTVYTLVLDRSTGNISATTLANPLNPEIRNRELSGISSDIRVGDILFISGLDYYSKGKVLGLSLLDGGIFYTDSISPLGLSYSGASSSTDGKGLTITWLTDNTKVDSFTVVTPGLDYKIGDVLYLRADGLGSQNPIGGGVDAKFVVSSIDTTPVKRLPDTWKVLSYTPPTMILSPLYDVELLKGLTESGIFTSLDANNRWLSFGRSKITKSRLKSGVFRRAVLTDNTIENSDYDATDRDFEKINNIKSLILSDIIFSNTGNRLSLATYQNSSFVGGTDEWINGIIYRSVLNKMTFERGIIKESAWIDGDFNGGTFYKNNSYDAKPKPGFEFYYTNRVLSYYKSGKTIGGIYNDRYSWHNGTFNGGEFVKSDWENGLFNGGFFYGSKWYEGTAKGGIFGNEETATAETAFYNGTIDYTTVSNASFFADDTSKTGVKNTVVWNDGVFNGGVFGSSRVYLPKDPPLKYEYSNYEHAVMNKPGNTNVKSLYLTVADNIELTKVSELLFEIDLSSTKNITELRFSLLSPSKRAFLVKDFYVGNGYVMKSVLTNDINGTPISLGSEPYASKFRFDFDFSSNISGNGINYYSDLTSLVNTQTSGNWTFLIESTSYDPIDVYVTYKLTFVTQNPDNNFVENEALWRNGVFNAGQFVSYARWIDGEFNGGKFISTKGSSVSGNINGSNLANEHSWENGVFNGGEFGNGSLGENSTWFNGVFNGGIFNGRLWKNGIFKNGVFNGSGNNPYGGWIYSTFSKGLTQSVSSKSNAIDFTDRFYGDDFFGLWLDGLVLDRLDATLTPQKYFTKLVTNSSNASDKLSAEFNGVLWMNGTFNHNSGLMKNSVWLSGTFSSGTFRLGSFNPYVRRNNESFGFSDAAVWENGTFNDGDFFYSEWRSGDFIYGTGFGMWFREGTAYYINAVNCIWGGTAGMPVWKNGNWDGSSFDYDGNIKDPMLSAILSKTSERNNNLIMSRLGSSNVRNIHVWNLFEDLSLAPSSLLDANADTIETKVPNYTPTQAIWQQNELNFIPPVVW